MGLISSIYWGRWDNSSIILVINYVPAWISPTDRVGEYRVMIVGLCTIRLMRLVNAKNIVGDYRGCESDRICRIHMVHG